MITIFKNGFQKTDTYQEKYNETFKAFDKKDALQQARDDIAEKDVVGADYSGWASTCVELVRSI